ncbi:acetylornithine deacetylase [Neptunicella sp. SCSIO 80796]|uniref:acetylornithine deacetylase n=1 Tax=Neptunicella plasticusilytica TaxID=3117012 RepID=UPI003A4D26CB
MKFIQHYRNIIATPTISAFDAGLDQTNLLLIQYLAEHFADFGFEISIQPVPDTREKYNLLAKIGSGTGGLLLAGHSDTVPFDEGKWNSDPFKLFEKDNRLFGLGTCDMKGFFAFILEALKDIPLNKLHKPLYILASADEETSMAGARFFASQQQVKPDVAIIGEPTELKPIYKHKGHMAHSLNIKGQAGHSSDPAKGVNAIEITYQAISQLLKLKQQLAERQDNSFAVPQATMNLGHIHGGDGENRICGHCQLNFDIRLLPGMSDAQVIAQLDELLLPLQQQWPDRISRELMYATVPSFSCKQEADIIQLAEKLTGFKPQSANYCTEAPFISELGCDTLVLGPGSINQAHQPDEFIALEYIDPTVNLLRNMIGHICLPQ